MANRKVVNVHVEENIVGDEFTFKAPTVDDNISLLFVERFFQSEVLAIWTGPGSTGVKLEPITDYTVNLENVELSEEVGQLIYGELKIINPTYIDVDLYIPVGSLVLHGDFVNDTDINQLINTVDEILSGTANYIVPQHVYFPVSLDLTSAGLLAFGFDNAKSQANYPELYAAIGDMWEQMHLDAGDPPSGAGNFYPTPTPDQYAKSALPEISFTDTNVDFATNTLIGLDSWVSDNRRDGSIFRLELVSGTFPTGLSEGIYYLDFSATQGKVSIHTTEQDAIEGINLVTFTDAGSGEFKLSQSGLSLASKSISQYIAFDGGTDNVLVSVLGKGPVKNGYTPNIAGVTTNPTIETVDPSGASNQTRGDEFYEYGYVKAEQVTPSGETVSALREVISLTVPANGSTNVITHGLNAKLEDLIVEVKYRDVSNNIYEVSKDMYISGNASNGWTNNSVGLINSLTQYNFQIGAGDQHYIDSVGDLVVITPGVGTYEITIIKPNLVATYVDTSNRSVREITTAVDELWNLPDANTVVDEYVLIRRGAGSGKVTPTTVSGQLIGGKSANEWELYEDGRLVVFPYAGNWEVKEYNDYGTSRVAKAFINFDGTGAITIRESINFSSITDLGGAGYYRVFFTNSMKTIDYSVTGTSGGAGGADQYVSVVYPLNQDYIDIYVRNSVASPIDSTIIMLHVFER